MKWSVRIETKAPEGDRDRGELIHASLDRLDRALRDYDASAGGDRYGWHVRLRIATASDPDAIFLAVDLARQAVQEYAERAGLPAWPVIRAEAVEETSLQSEVDVPDPPNVRGVIEALEVLEVSRHEVPGHRAADPLPETAERAAAPSYIQTTNDASAAGRERKPGDPTGIRMIGEIP